MTYGETTATLRRELSDLLVEADVPRARARHPLTADESRLVQAYRASVLTWLNRTTQTVVPDNANRADWQWGPARLFADRLNRVVVATTDLTPPAQTIDLGAPSTRPTVESWRRAAVTATLGLERELDPIRRISEPTPTRRGAPTSDYLERLRVVDDNAALTNAIILLDIRTGARPGWHRLGGAKDLSSRREVSAEGLLNALELCRRWTRAHTLPTALDDRGHRTPLALTPGPVRPGMPGVLDALQNTLVRLDTRPQAHVMRMLIRSQAALTHDLLKVTNPDDPVLLTRRARYGALAAATENLGGKIGAPALVFIESEQARALLQSTPTATTAEAARAIEILAAIDHQITRYIRGGIADATYLVTNGRHLGPPGPGGIRLSIAQWDPIDRSTSPRLLDAVRALAATLPALPPTIEPAAAAPTGPARDHLDTTIDRATPPRTAETSPLRREPTRTEFSHADQSRLRAASFPSPKVQVALEDYLLRRPTTGGGTPSKKAKGKEPPTR